MGFQNRDINQLVKRTAGKSKVSIGSILVAILVASCSESLSADEENDLIVQARSMSLSDRYALHQEVYNRTRPPHEFLAPVVAELGEPAYRMAVEKAATGTISDVSAALAVITEVVDNGKVRCSNADKLSIYTNVKEHLTEKEAAAYNPIIYWACHV